MRKIAIIGAGQAGLLVAHGLRCAGYDVTLYSDRTPEQFLHASRPTGTAGRFATSLAYERELGLAHWDDQAPHVGGVHLTFCPAAGNRLLTLSGRMKSPALAIDLRLQSHRWMRQLVERGGCIEVENVTVERLDEIAAAHDLVVVAAGRGELCTLFERDAGRSVYDRPQRNLAMLIVRGPMAFDGVPFLPVKFNFFAPLGEAFWVPYYHKDAGATWNMLFEPRPGQAMDRFGKASSLPELFDIAGQVIKEFIPWDAAWFASTEPVDDEYGWLTGAVTPTVRRPVARLPSGRVVAAVGDTQMALDPIAGQGANNGNKMAHNLVESIIARGDQPYDAEWLTATFERFYARHGGPTNRFNNMFLEEITAAGKEILIAQYGSDGSGNSPEQKIADAIVENFDDPAGITDDFFDVARARALIQRTSGQHWLWPALRGRLGIGKNQLRQALGMAPRHPRVD